jgi:transcriptional regulator with XRE-family HTH domain
MIIIKQVSFFMSNNYAPKEKYFLVKVGRRIQKLRKSKGFSQESFALEIELDRTYIGGIERGERNVAILNLKRIANGLGISISDLLKL